MVRHIRDEQAQKLKGKSKAEIIAFFRKAGEAAQKAKQNRPPLRESQKSASQHTPADGGRM